MDVTWPNHDGAANTGWQYVLMIRTWSTYLWNYRERRHNSNFRKRSPPSPCWPPSIFVSITQSHLSALQNLRKLELVFFPIMTRTRRKKELFLAISVRESTRHLRCERQVGSYKRGARRPVNTANIYICQSSYITKVRRLTIHSFPQYVQRGHMQAYRTCRVTQ